MFFILFSILSVELPLEKTVVLKGVSATKVPEITVDGEGAFYYRDFDESAVYKLDAEGNLLFSFGRPGEGPGELSVPFRLALFDNDRKLLIVSALGRASLFETATGKFIREFHIPSCNQITVLGPNAFLSIGGSPGGNYFHQYDLKGKKGRSYWPTPKIDLSKPFTRNYAATVIDGTIYFAEGTYPQMNVVSSKRDDVWKLDPPKYYVEPPSKPLSRAIRFDRVKVQEYYESFSQVYNVRALDHGLLAVAWNLYKPISGSVDIYRASDRKLLSQNHPVQGLMADASGNRIFVLEEIDDEENNEIIHKIHSYRVDIKQ